jgi:hypothetical protein
MDTVCDDELGIEVDGDLTSAGRRVRAVDSLASRPITARISDERRSAGRRQRRQLAMNIKTGEDLRLM